MSLIKCKECQAKISDTARKCPKCGAKTERGSSNKERLIGVSFIAIIIIFLISMIVFICHVIVTNRSSYKYGEEALDILNSFKNNFISEKQAYNSLDDLYDDIEEEMDNLENNTTSEYDRLSSIHTAILYIQVDISSSGGATINDVDEAISKIKSNMRFFS